MNKSHHSPRETPGNVTVSAEPEASSTNPGKTPSGRPKAKGGTDPFTSRLSDEFFDELRASRGLGRQLTPLRGVSIAAPDPIIEEALHAIQQEFGHNAEKNEKLLAARYLTEVERVTERLNSRQLPRMTRLLLAQRGVYAHVLTSVIRSMVEPTNGHSKFEDGMNAGVPAESEGSAKKSMTGDSKLDTE